MSCCVLGQSSGRLDRVLAVWRVFMLIPLRAAGGGSTFLSQLRLLPLRGPCLLFTPPFYPPP